MKAVALTEVRQVDHWMCAEIVGLVQKMLKIQKSKTHVVDKAWPESRTLKQIMSQSLFCLGMSRSQIHTICTVTSLRQPINRLLKSLLWMPVSALPCSGADESRLMPFIHPRQEGAAGSELTPGSQGVPGRGCLVPRAWVW